MSTRELQFRPDIEGLRAVAILIVVAFHAGVSRLGGGYLGVDVFFVLSGFLITGVLVDEVSDTGSVSLTGFWARRARRLLPAAGVVTLVVLLANAWVLSPFEQITRAETGGAFAFYGSNILFAIRSTDYFGTAAVRDPLLHTWSLSVEEQFYLFFAPTLLALAASARAHGPATFRRRFVAVTVVISLLSLAGCFWLVRRYPTVAFFVLPSRAWEFGIGALALVVQRHASRVAPAVRDVVAFLSVAAIAASAVLVREGEVRPLGLATLAPTLGAAGLILSGAAATPTLVGRFLSTAPMRMLGRLSYSWYLWHWPLLVYLNERVPQPSLRLRLAVALGSLLPAAITYRLVESPIRFSTTLQRRARATVVGALVLAVATWGAAQLAEANANRILETPRYAVILRAREQAPVYSDGCQLPLLAVESPPCRYGPGRNDTTLVVFGDSHAAHWFSAFDSLVALRGWSFVNLTKTGCPSVTVTLDNTLLGRRYTECETWRAATIRRIVTLRPTIVVLSNVHGYNVVVGDQHPHTDSSGLARREWSLGLRQSLEALVPSGARLIVLEDTPQPGFDVPRCLVRFVDTPSRCDAPLKRAVNPLVSGSELAAIRAVPGVTRISLNAAFCGQTSCPVMADGIVRFRDANHLTVRFAQSLTHDLSLAITAALRSLPER